jgi:hypothetical protein
MEGLASSVETLKKPILLAWWQQCKVRDSADWNVPSLGASSPAHYRATLGTMGSQVRTIKATWCGRCSLGMSPII